MLRDIHEDLGLNRLYMPMERLREHGVLEYVGSAGKCVSGAVSTSEGELEQDYEVVKRAVDV